MAEIEKPQYAYYGLTYSQYHDCLKVGRSPKTGRLYRTSNPSNLERKCRETNWTKLVITGCISNLEHAIYGLGFPSEKHASLLKQLHSLKQELVNRNTANYEAFKLTEKNRP